MSKKIKVTSNQKELNISLSEFYRVYNVKKPAIIRWFIKYRLGSEITNKTLCYAHTLINSAIDYFSRDNF